MDLRTGFPFCCKGVTGVIGEFGILSSVFKIYFVNVRGLKLFNEFLECFGLKKLL